MLQSLHITNYALIDRLSIGFYPGLNIITGETGAGKSILLGALSLILGQRADLGVLLDKNKKCTVEGVFAVEGYGLEPFFREQELDYDTQTIMRREISPSGKSRAFVNDTPVRLKVLQDLALQLVDIHSQHQNLELGNRRFQLKLVDLVAGNEKLLGEYRMQYGKLQQLRGRRSSLQEEAERSRAELDYLEFQHRQLEEARLEEKEQEELENELGTLEHAEELKLNYGELAELLEGDEAGVLIRIREQLRRLSRLSEISQQAGRLKQRFESCYLELKDLAAESGTLAEQTEYDPERIRLVSDRLNTIYGLQQKFRVGTVAELIALKDELDQRIRRIASYDEAIEEVSRQLEACVNKVTELAGQLSTRRKGVEPQLTGAVTGVLQKLGMPYVCFELAFEEEPEAGPEGMDKIAFLFSSNKNTALQDIARIASGGEISRVMLALKTLITESKSLPTIVFDEIDTGISGEVAVRMGDILKDMSHNMQVINITHLPQIAGKGQHHFKVYKYETEERSFTSIRELNEPERIEELAQMLGGEHVSGTARETARELLD